jgi:hypothetical protein
VGFCSQGDDLLIGEDRGSGGGSSGHRLRGRFTGALFPLALWVGFTISIITIIPIFKYFFEDLCQFFLAVLDGRGIIS